MTHENENCPCTHSGWAMGTEIIPYWWYWHDFSILLSSLAFFFSFYSPRIFPINGLIIYRGTSWKILQFFKGNRSKILWIPLLKTWVLLFLAILDYLYLNIYPTLIKSLKVQVLEWTLDQVISNHVYKIQLI